jgi:hypothetical protein
MLSRHHDRYRGRPVMLFRHRTQATVLRASRVGPAWQHASLGQFSRASGAGRAEWCPTWSLRLPLVPQHRECSTSTTSVVVLVPQQRACSTHAAHAANGASERAGRRIRVESDSVPVAGRPSDLLGRTAGRASAASRSGSPCSDPAGPDGTA